MTKVHVLLLAVVAGLAGCTGPDPMTSAAVGSSGGGGATTTTTTTASSSTCSVPYCPAGALLGAQLEPCCQGAAPLACAMPAGILTQTCPVKCASSICALSPGGTFTCCDFTSPANPCASAVP